MRERIALGFTLAIALCTPILHAEGTEDPVAAENLDSGPTESMTPNGGDTVADPVAAPTDSASTSGTPTDDAPTSGTPTVGGPTTGTSWEPMPTTGEDPAVTGDPTAVPVTDSSAVPQGPPTRIEAENLLAHFTSSDPTEQGESLFEGLPTDSEVWRLDSPSISDYDRELPEGHTIEEYLQASEERWAAYRADSEQFFDSRRSYNSLYRDAEDAREEFSREMRGEAYDLRSLERDLAEREAHLEWARTERPGEIPGARSAYAEAKRARDSALESRDAWVEDGDHITWKIGDSVGNWWDAQTHKMSGWKNMFGGGIPGPVPDFDKDTYDDGLAARERSLASAQSTLSRTRDRLDYLQTRALPAAQTAYDTTSQRRAAQQEAIRVRLEDQARREAQVRAQLEGFHRVMTRVGSAPEASE